MQESVSGTTSHVRFFWTCNEIKGSYDKIIITIVCALVTIQTATMVNYCGTLCCLGCCTIVQLSGAGKGEVDCAVSGDPLPQSCWL